MPKKACIPYFQGIFDYITFPSDSAGEESACKAGDIGDMGFIPQSGRSPGEEDPPQATHSSILA